MQTHTPSKTTHFAHPRKNVGTLGIEPGMHVADFGSGSGANTFAIAERMEGSGHLYAIDVQRDLLRRISNEARQRGLKNIDVIWADLEAPLASKIADGTLDFVLVSNLLFQVPDKAAVLSEARRILKPQARVALIDWAESFGNTGPAKEDVVSKEAALTLAKEGGFELVKEFSAGAHHYGLIMRPVAKA